MDIQEIRNTIEQLENDITTFENCFKLASLYTVRDNYEKYYEQQEEQMEEVDVSDTTDDTEDEVEQEYSDILPQYKIYTDIKKQYQLGQISEQAVETQIKKVCDEISEFIRILYSCTDMPTEREHIKNMLGGLQNL